MYKDPTENETRKFTFAKFSDDKAAKTQENGKHATFIIYFKNFRDKINTWINLAVLFASLSRRFRSQDHRIVEKKLTFYPAILSTISNDFAKKFSRSAQSSQRLVDMWLYSHSLNEFRSLLSFSYGEFPNRTRDSSRSQMIIHLNHSKTNRQNNHTLLGALSVCNSSAALRKRFYISVFLFYFRCLFREKPKRFMEYSFYSTCWFKITFCASLKWFNLNVARNIFNSTRYQCKESSLVHCVVIVIYFKKRASVHWFRLCIEDKKTVLISAVRRWKETS